MKPELYLLCFFIVIGASQRDVAPHIILIIADDLGWNDVGFHGSRQIPTPNIDALAYSGVILNNYYVQPICTPSRGALLTAFHPIHTGLNHYVIVANTPYGLPLDFKILPQYLNKLGYVSCAVGKWHLGTFKKEYTPIYRGFFSHYGYWTGHIDYYDHMALESPGLWGYDFRRNMTIDREAYGRYTTDLLTNEAVTVINNHNKKKPLFLYLAHLAVHSANPYSPLQAPNNIVKKFSYIKDQNRRKFAGMLYKLDEGVGKVVQALKRSKMLSNSIIVFSTDNGGPAGGFDRNAASNWPLRGVKASLWEGGVRGAGFVWSPFIKSPGRISTNMMQIIDWMPTLYSAAGGDVKDLPTVDGVNQWDSIFRNGPPVRHMMLHNIDPKYGGASVRVGNWKYIYKPSEYSEKWDSWFGPSGRKKRTKKSSIRNSMAGRAVTSVFPSFSFERISKPAEVLCEPVPVNSTRNCRESPCLFHIKSDPCEYYDLSSSYPSVMDHMKSVLEKFNDTAISPGNKPPDPAADPRYWQYTWTNWKDYPSPLLF